MSYASTEKEIKFYQITTPGHDDPSIGHITYEARTVDPATGEEECLSSGMLSLDECVRYAG